MLDIYTTLIHRSGLQEELIGGWERVGPDRFLVNASWPQSHPLFAPLGAFHDPLLITETMRQAALLVAHTGYDIPEGHRFVLSGMSSSVHPDRILLDGDADAVIEVGCASDVAPGRRPTALRLEMTARRGGAVAATSRMATKFASPAGYARLRGDNLTARPRSTGTTPLSPRLVDRARTQDVVLAATGESGQWQLHIDTDHPALRTTKEHNHVPGILLLEAARQAAHAAQAADGAEVAQDGYGPQQLIPAELTIDFHRYAEFTPACLLRARALSAPGSFQVDAVQGGLPVFTATVSLLPCPVPARVAP